MSLNTAFTSQLDARIEQLKTDRVYKRLNFLDSPQSARVQMEGRGEVLILSSNNYLGLTTHPKVREAAVSAGSTTTACEPQLLRARPTTFCSA